MARTRITSVPDEPAASATDGPTGPGAPTPRERPGAERTRLALALLLSVAAHALLLALSFGDDGPGLPGLAWPWQERRLVVPDLRVVLVPPDPPPTQRPAEAAVRPSPGAPLEPGVAGGRVVTPPVARSPAPPPPV